MSTVVTLRPLSAVAFALAVCLSVSAPPTARGNGVNRGNAAGAGSPSDGSTSSVAVSECLIQLTSRAAFEGVKLRSTDYDTGSSCTTQELKGVLSDLVRRGDKGLGELMFQLRASVQEGIDNYLRGNTKIIRQIVKQVAWGNRNFESLMHQTDELLKDGAAGDDSVLQAIVSAVMKSGTESRELQAAVARTLIDAHAYEDLLLLIDAAVGEDGKEDKLNQLFREMQTAWISHSSAPLEDVVTLSKENGVGAKEFAAALGDSLAWPEKMPARSMMAMTNMAFADDGPQLASTILAAVTNAANDFENGVLKSIVKLTNRSPEMEQSMEAILMRIVENMLGQVAGGPRAEERTETDSIKENEYGDSLSFVDVLADIFSKMTRGFSFSTDSYNQPENPQAGAAIRDSLMSLFGGSSLPVFPTPEQLGRTKGPDTDGDASGGATEAKSTSSGNQ